MGILSALTYLVGCGSLVMLCGALCRYRNQYQAHMRYELLAELSTPWMAISAYPIGHGVCSPCVCAQPTPLKNATVQTVLGSRRFGKLRRIATIGSAQQTSVKLMQTAPAVKDLIINARVNPIFADYVRGDQTHL